MITLNKVYQGHALNILKSFPSNFIDVVVTSPPYYALRNYEAEPVLWKDGTMSSLGSEPTVELYVNHLCDIFDEVKRVLKDTGVCYVVIGDTYASGGGKVNKHINSSLKPKHKFKRSKSLLLVPERFAIEMVDREWILRNVIIWNKPNPAPESVKDRFTRCFEYIYFFTKNPKYFFRRLKVECSKSTYKRIKANNTIKNRKAYRDNMKDIVPVPLEQQIKYAKDRLVECEKYGIIYRNMWNNWLMSSACSEARGIKHYAMFPKRLVKRCIVSGSPTLICVKCGKLIATKKDVCNCKYKFKKSIVLDPFMGSGTTALVAEELKRNWIGIELNKEYINTMYERFNK